MAITETPKFLIILFTLHPNKSQDCQTKINNKNEKNCTRVPDTFLRDKC
jgi:hypothetical protein